MSGEVLSNVISWLGKTGQSLFQSPGPPQEPEGKLQSIYSIYNILLIVVTRAVYWINVQASVQQCYEPVE
jgi:hypothetical protein